jgi:hypothetical protein
LLSSLNNFMIYHDSAPPVPKLSGPTGEQVDTLVFYGPASGDASAPALIYNAGTGAYPVGTFSLFFNATSDITNFPLHFTVTFFDSNRITVSSADAPTVIGRFDMTDIDQSALNIFVYGILGVVLPAAFDQISDWIYNGTDIVSD